MTSPTSDHGGASLRGRVLADKYQLVERVGAGAMGEVWSARHLTLDKQVAVKVVRIEATTDPLVTGRFKSEARAASRLDHPNSVQIMDFGEEQDGLLYIVMEFLRGQDLGTLLKRTGRLSEQRATHIIVQVLSALTTAHQNNIVHRDLKPANIMLIKGPDGVETVKVCDFGIAKLQDPMGPEDPTGMMTLTRAGAVVGTPSYMSPEQAGGKRVDARSDLFSCGVMLYHMLSGEKPFRANTLMGLLSQVMTEEPKPLPQLVSTIDTRLVDIVMRAMSKKPNERFQSAREMRDALNQIVERPEDRTMTMHSPATPDATRALPASALPSGPGATRPMVDLHGTRARPDAHMQSLGGSPLNASHSGTWARTGHFEGRPVKETSSAPKWVALLALVAMVAAGAFFVARSSDRADIKELHHRVELGSWGSAEDYALEHFIAFEHDPQAKLVMQDILQKRREALRLDRETGIAFDPSFRLTPSRWIGHLQFAERSERPAFTLEVVTVGDGTVSGYLDWPDDGLRAAVVGYSHGNHLLLWDYELLTEPSMRNSAYNLYDKKSLLVGDGVMKGFDGPSRGQFEAKRAP